MKIWFRQIYIEPSAKFPFSHHFPRHLSREVAALTEPSTKFIEDYGEDFNLMFNVSAKKALQENEIRGPTVFKKSKDVEYTLFLPYTIIMRDADVPKHALQYLLKGVCDVFDLLAIDKSRLLKNQESLIDGICSDRTMLEGVSRNETDNKTAIRALFTAFLEKQ